MSILYFDLVSRQLKACHSMAQWNVPLMLFPCLSKDYMLLFLYVPLSIRLTDERSKTDSIRDLVKNIL
jgi:hypothetical protein